MRLIEQRPETPIEETWAWSTDIIVSANGTEQRIELLDTPRRSFTFRYQFDDVGDFSTFVQAMLMVGAGARLPLRQYGTRLTAPAALGAAAINVNSSRSEFRDGDRAYISDAAGGELVTLNAVTANQVTLTGVLSRAYDTRALLCPVADTYTGNGATYTRGNPDDAGSASMTFNEVDFLDPFLSVLNTTVLPTFNGLPLLERNAIGQGFDHTIDTGAEVIDFGGVVYIRTPWKHTQVNMPTREYLCHRFENEAEWLFWRRFADYCRGSLNPFYTPTFRQDFKTTTVPAPGATTLTFLGLDYAVNWFPHATFKALTFISETGAMHHALVSAAVQTAGNSVLTFAPALPAGFIVEKTCLLLKVRIADDRVTCLYDDLETTLKLSLRTVDE